MEKNKAVYGTNIQFLSGGGEMGELTRSKDWSKTAIGPPEYWPQSLRTSLSILLNSKFPMFLWWGPELTCFYNDAYRPSLGENGKHPSILGMPAKEAWLEIWHIIKPLIDQVLQGGDAVWFEDLLVPIYRNGKIEEVYWTFSYSPVTDETGKIAGVVVICSETTDSLITRKKLEELNRKRASDLENQLQLRIDQLMTLNESLKKSEERYHLMVEEVQDYAILYLNREGIVENWNTGAEKIKGYKAEEIIGKSFSNFYTEEDRKNNLPFNLLKLAETTGKAVQQGWRVRKDGSLFWASVVITAVHNEKREVIGFSKVTHDLTEKKEADDKLKANTVELEEKNEKLRKSEERYHLMVEEVQDYAILYLNREGIVENWNVGAEKIKGYKAEEIIGRSFSNFYTEEDRKDNLPQKLLARAVETGRAVQEGWRVKKDGSRFWASVVITAVHNNKQEVIGFSKFTHDLTEKKQADDKLNAYADALEHKNEDLKKVNKELESFAYISSHDLQEPLRKIQTFSARLLDKEYANLSEAGKDHFKRMQHAAERMQILINDLLTYSRTNTSERKYETVDLNNIVKQVKSDLKEELEQKHATLETDDLCQAHIIPFQFRQLLLNLITNSLKFSQPALPPHIKIKSRIETGSKLDNKKLVADAKYCHLSISDNGIGFEPEYNERIFGLFQRLHGRSDYQGTGIGLAIVKKIVENHNGFITAHAAKNKGATFDIYLPV